MDGTSQPSLEILSHNYAPFNAAVAKYIEKLEQPDPRIAGQAFREKARGVGYVLKALGVAALLTLIGVSLIVLCQQRSAIAPVENSPSAPPKWQVPQPPSGGTEKVVTKFTRFNTARGEGLNVVTVWNFDKSTDDNPESQYCYLESPEEVGSRKIELARRSQSGPLVPQTSASVFNRFVREIHGVAGEIDYETALGKCYWFPG
jgi:hypothetical protein